MSEITWYLFFCVWLNFTSLIPLSGEGNGNPLQYSCQENPMDGGAWWAAVHGVAKSPTRLSDFPFTFHFHALEKEMATHSSVLAWRIPGTGEPGGLPSLGSHRVGHDWSDLAAAAAAIPSRSIYIITHGRISYFHGWVVFPYVCGCMLYMCSIYMYVYMCIHTHTSSWSTHPLIST